MKYFLILLIIVGFFGIVYAVPEPFSPEEAFRFSENVIFGKILSVEILSEPQITKTENTYSERSGIAVYKIEVEKYLKNSSDDDTITVAGLFLREPHPMAYETYPYEVGQRVLLYLQNNEYGYGDTDLVIRSSNSKIIEDTLCPQGTSYVKGVCVVDEIKGKPKPTGSYELDELLCIGGRGMVIDENCQRVRPSPYSQQQDGIDPEQVKCNRDLYRAYKTYDGSAFCASGFALRELIHRGYAEAFDSISSWIIDRPNTKATEYCPTGQELTQWGWYGEKNPDVIDTNIDLNHDPDEDSYGVEFTFDPTNNPETDSKSMIWVFVECRDSFR